jgi:hypothetical protein
MWPDPTCTDAQSWGNTKHWLQWEELEITRKDLEFIMMA